MERRGEILLRNTVLFLFYLVLWSAKWDKTL